MAHLSLSATLRRGGAGLIFLGPWRGSPLSDLVTTENGKYSTTTRIRETQA
jgi:hypothetical protein